MGFALPQSKGHDVDFEEMKRWYDGYTFNRLTSVYNPNSVVQAIKRDLPDFI